MEIINQILLNLFGYFWLFDYSFGDIGLYFDRLYSPPYVIPNDYDKRYSLPLNHIPTYPIVAYLVKDKVRVTSAEHGAIAQSPFKIESLDYEVFRKKKGAVDQWKHDGGALCQYTVIFDITFAYKRNLLCGENKDRLKLYKLLRLNEGKLSAHSLFHYHRNVTKIPSNKRVYKFTVMLPDNTTVTSITYPVLIENTARYVQFCDDNLTTVTANNGFSQVLEVLDFKKKRLTTGLDSSVYVLIAAYNTVGTHVEMNGTNSAADPKTGFTYVIRRAQKGLAVFSDIRILATGNITLKATFKPSNDPWGLYPVLGDIYKDDEDEKSLNSMKPVAQSVKELRIQNKSEFPIYKHAKAFIIKAQTAAELVILTPLNTISKKNGANFPIYPYIEVAVIDRKKDLIKTGRDSRLHVTVKATPGTACLSTDASFIMYKGKGIFKGSICQPISAVKLHFEITNMDNVVVKSKLTNDIEITADIYIGHYINFYLEDEEEGSFEQIYIENALRKIKSGNYTFLNDRNIYVKHFDNKLDVLQTTKEYELMIRHGMDNPNERIHGIIGMGSNLLTEKLAPLLNYDEMPLIAVKENKKKFGEKKHYPYFNRLCWDEGAIIKSVLTAALSRRWTHIIIVSDEEHKMNEAFYDGTSEHGIRIVQEVCIGTDLDDDELDVKMLEIKSYKIRIIFFQVPSPYNTRVLRAAIRNEVACINGYQWVTLEEFSWQFPWTNKDEECKEFPTCTFAFKGLHAFSSAYPVMDPLTEPIDIENNEYGSHQITGIYSLAYDALMIFAIAMNMLIKNKKTMTGINLAHQIRKTKTVGLTGIIKFDNKGNRPGYMGYLVTLYPHPSTSDTLISTTAIFSRFIHKLDKNPQQESHVQALPPLDAPPWSYEVAPTGFPNANFVNKRLFNTSTGMIVGERFELTPVPPNNTMGFFMDKEIAVAPFFCESGCGGKSVTETNINLYEFGNCTAMNKCKCYDGYYGSRCEKMTCKCNNGYCQIPNVCVCRTGWKGERCDKALCDQCQHGKCTGPNICTCNKMWIGANCEISLIGTIAFTVSLLVFGAISLFIIIKYIGRRYALLNLDWLVDWIDVIEHEQQSSVVSSMQSSLTYQWSKFVTWKHRKCYAERFSIHSLDVGSKKIRKEILLIKGLKQHNIILFIGACLEAPNVCLLLELCSKGSLEDVLSNDSVPLDWSFRFSILKDICRGMSYIHQSPLQSHGRLKSRNCLIDDRWTCKISGHGCPTMRYLAPRISVPDEPENKPSSMFWTSPELLRKAKCAADVKNGTKAGDVFSFAIILTEIINREEPYSAELTMISSDDILNLLRSKESPECKPALKLLSTLDIEVEDYFRPHIDSYMLPENIREKTQILKLLSETWNEQPHERPTFKTLLSNLNQIYPMKGDVIDNLVNMLQKYSTDLEGIVAERTKDLIAEKQKTEMLIRQMLPKQVVEDLKYGRSVDPESFDCVTIFFSDIVGFTKIATESTPLQIVELLNDLYTTFDEILDNYDVYKVETVGDAYMVVSGLPIRSETKHAGEIATMSLDLLSSVSGFKIKHMPDRMLQLRVGIHSGPIVAGVIGLKMPRYCLFGDTVNTASRMESSSLALRIQMSKNTKDILDQLGGYEYECRGEISVKGKGAMTTYWLLGKDTFIKPLPHLSLALAISEHEIK